MSDSQKELTFNLTYDHSEKELMRNLPPWEKADNKQKTVIVLIKTIILLPVFVVLFLISSLYAIYLICYIAPLIEDNSNTPELYY